MALRFFDSDESKELNCSNCKEEDRELRGCVSQEFIKEWENEETGFYIYNSDFVDMEKVFFQYKPDIACYVCPRAAIYDETYELINLYSLCKEFTCLPYPGSLFNQPATIVEAFSIISGEIGRLERKRMDTNKQESFGNQPSTKKTKS